MKILLVDDSVLFLNLLAGAFRARAEFSHVACAETAAAATELLRKRDFDAMLVDIRLPDANGFDLAVEAQAIRPALKIVGFSASCTDATAYRLQHSTAVRGFIDKHRDSQEEMWRALAAIQAGRRYISAKAQCALDRMKSATDGFDKLLSPREIPILRFVGSGWPDEAIAHALAIRPATVKWHCKRIMWKLNLHDRSRLVVYAVERGLTKFC